MNKSAFFLCLFCFDWLVWFYQIAVWHGNELGFFRVLVCLFGFCVFCGFVCLLCLFGFFWLLLLLFFSALIISAFWEAVQYPIFH